MRRAEEFAFLEGAPLCPCPLPAPVHRPRAALHCTAEAAGCCELQAEPTPAPTELLPWLEPSEPQAGTRRGDGKARSGGGGGGGGGKKAPTTVTLDQFVAQRAQNGGQEDSWDAGGSGYVEHADGTLSLGEAPP